MEKNDLRQILGIVLVLLIAAGLAWAGSQGSVEAFGFPLFTLGVALAFIIQWLAFIPAWIFKTEKFYDLTGTITYLAVTIMALLLSGNVSPRAWLVAGLVGSNQPFLLLKTSGRAITGTTTMHSNIPSYSLA